MEEKTTRGEVLAHKQGPGSSQQVCMMQPDTVSVCGVEDMASLDELHEGAILHNLLQRYTQQKIYTYIGSILAAVNPYKRVPSLYDAAVVETYSRHHLGEIPPHIYAIANECYQSLWKRNNNQCVLISGESGAGKTESTKLILCFLSAMSQNSQHTSHVEKTILESSPILEAFGNAKTVYNNNSSRFGKFIQLHFNRCGSIQGGQIIDYLLEKNRVVRQNPGERNYHIFYALLAGATKEQKESFSLSCADTFHYLRQTGCVHEDETLHDKNTFQEVLSGLRTMMLSEEGIYDVLKLLAAILHTGNIQFVTAGGAQVSSKTALCRSAELLGFDSDHLAEVLTHRSMILRGEEISTPLTVEQALDSRDSLAMALYSHCFTWILRCLNKRIHGNSNFKSVGILDIFGFENFEVNHFEQFNINYANEKLQEYFNKHIFSLEQLEYSKEGLVWEDVNWMDNGECLDLIEKKLGLLALINEESHFPKATDATLLEKLHSQHAKNTFYVKPRVSMWEFGVKHYAGEVVYDVRGVLEKNRDTFRDDILNLLKESRLDFVYDLFESVSSRRNSEPLGTTRKLTVSLQFKNSLHSLMATLSSSNPFFVRCIKPNNIKTPGVFDQKLVLEQLRYSGMLQTVEIRRKGFPIRRTFQDFCCRYCVLMRDMSFPDDLKGRSVRLLQLYNSGGAEWQVGKTKVFMREALECRLERQREMEVTKAATLIQAFIKGRRQRTFYRRVLRCVVVLQKNFRAFSCRRHFLRMRWAAVSLQKHYRGQRSRRLYQQLQQRKCEEDRIKMLELEPPPPEPQDADARREEPLAGDGEALVGEACQVEEILRLEREIDALQKQKDAQERSLTAHSLQRLQQLRDQELRRLEDEACRAAHHFLQSLNFHEIDECVRNIEGSLPPPRHHREEEEDEGLGADEDGFKDSPNPSEVGQSEGQRTSGIRSGDESSEEDPYANESMLPVVTGPTNQSPPSSGDSAYCRVKQEEEVELIPPDEDSDYDADEYDDALTTTRLSVSHADCWTSHQRSSVATSTSSGVYRCSSEAQSSFEDSEDDFEKFDPDEESVCRRDSVYSCVTLPYFHSFLFIKGGLMNMWKRRWCVLKDETFLWFRSKQEALKQGWLYKKGGGSSTLSRRNWKRRWFVLRQNKLIYYDNDAEDKLKGMLDIHAAKEVIDNTGKENGIDIIMPERTYHLIAESAEDASHWYSVLIQVHNSTEQEIREMHDEQANPQNAVGSLDVGIIDSVCASDNPDRPNSFVVITAHRLLHCTADSPEEMHHWITLLQRSKGDTRVQGQEFLIRGWLYKEVKGASRAAVKLKKFWFVLTHDSLDQFRSSESSATKLGTLLLNSLCRVEQKDEQSFRQTGYWMLTVFGRRHAYRLFSKLQTEANRWACAVQNVIDNKPQIETHTQQLIQDIRENCLNMEVVEQIYHRNPILRYTHHPLHTPLLALPYGELEKVKGYTSLTSEALRWFGMLQHVEGEAEPAQFIQELLQIGHDLRPLRDELFCQLVKQTTGDSAHIDSWRVMACICCTFSPTSRSILKYVRFHFRRTMELYPGTEQERYAAFSQDALRHGRGRECVPSLQEIRAVLSRQEMSSTVYCHGGGACSISITSHTTAGEVVDKLMRGLDMDDCRNTFALFEHSGSTDKAIENKAVVADVLAKFEKLSHGPQSPSWQLYFKLYCFLDTDSVPRDGVEFAFMFEQAHEAVIQGQYPAPEETLQFLAALRLQYLLGDHTSHNSLLGEHASPSSLPELEQLFPVSRLRSRLQLCTRLTGANPAARKRSSFLEGTLRKSFRGMAGRLKQQEEEPSMEAWLQEEAAMLRSSLQEKWRKVEGMSQRAAMQKYMSVVQEWPGCSSTLFSVQCEDATFPAALWLAVGRDGVSVYKRGEVWPLEVFPYELILSFGAPHPNAYKMTVEGRELQFQTNQVMDIAKLMKAYISMIVKKRYSTCPSVSSHGSQW